jgi:hypothetical protein
VLPPQVSASTSDAPENAPARPGIWSKPFARFIARSLFQKLGDVKVELSEITILDGSTFPDKAQNFSPSTTHVSGLFYAF